MKIDFKTLSLADLKVVNGDGKNAGLWSAVIEGAGLAHTTLHGIATSSLGVTGPAAWLAGVVMGGHIMRKLYFVRLKMKRYFLSTYQFFLFLFFSYLLTNKFTVGVNTYLSISAFFMIYSVLLEFLINRTQKSRRVKSLLWGLSYCPPMFMTIIIFILSNYK